MVYFQDGSYVASSLTAAAQAAAVNGTAEGALLTTVVTSTNFGTCYIAGQHVKRVRAAGADSIWDMCSGLGPVYVSGVDVTAAGVLIDATGECGGGGGGGAVGGAYVPVITGTTATDAGASFIRSGGETPEAGDFVLVACNFSVTALALETVDFEVTLPVTPAELLTEVPILTVVRTSGDLTLPYIYAQLSGGSTLRIQAVAPVTLETVMQMSLHFSYLVEAA